MIDYSVVSPKRSARGLARKHHRENSEGLRERILEFLSRIKDRNEVALETKVHELELRRETKPIQVPAPDEKPDPAWEPRLVGSAHRVSSVVPGRADAFQPKVASGAGIHTKSAPSRTGSNSAWVGTTDYDRRLLANKPYIMGLLANA